MLNNEYLNYIKHDCTEYSCMYIINFSRVITLVKVYRRNIHTGRRQSLPSNETHGVITHLIMIQCKQFITHVIEGSITSKKKRHIHLNKHISVRLIQYVS